VLLAVCLVFLLAWVFAFVLFHVTVIYIHVLLLVAVVFLVLHRIFEWRG
jgi:hypothetical protein